MLHLKIDRAVLEQIRQRLSKYSTAINISIALLSLIYSFVMLELSSRDFFSLRMGMEFLYVALNIMTLGVLWSIALLLSNRMWISSLLVVNISGVIAVVNHYVTMYHGMPLSFLVLKNFTTAMAVASSYHFSIDETVLKILAIMLFLTSLCVLSRFFATEKKCGGIRRWIRSAIFVVASIVVVWVGYTGNNPIKPPQTIDWLWSESYYKYGYTACTVESIFQSLNPIVKPTGYSLDAVSEIEIESAGDENSTPDIILILNESFYDLHQVADFTTDISYMQNIDSMENIQKGYAVVPVDGGGTNSSEYELLTGNSMQLMPGITPFNTIDLYDANSITSYLNALGYDTTASHSEPGENYARLHGYNALGFKNMHFDDDFEDLEWFYNRYFSTDRSIYQNMIRWYEESPKDQPRFQYVLTIQNHGDWNINDPDQDIVHIQEDFGQYTDVMNEYLSGICLTDQAFKILTDYFSKVDRPVIVCMVGDHSPSFASNIIDENYSDAEKQLLLRKVPVVFWANYGLESADLGTMSMNYVVPTLFDLAQIPMNRYYRYMLQVKEQVPILTDYGVYYDSKGNRYEYEDANSPYKKLTDDYFNLEYYNIKNPTGSLLSD